MYSGVAAWADPGHSKSKKIKAHKSTDHHYGGIAGARSHTPGRAVAVASGKKERDNVASMTGLQFTVTIGALPESTFSV
ncbi:hypothetical protein ACLEDJ_17025, partial [Lonsdalea quercina]|uniref:hypothetical protein n=2 Tax=Lonsdalea quercina TaxID=71657 RepID=UPI003974BAA7